MKAMIALCLAWGMTFALSAQTSWPLFNQEHAAAQEDWLVSPVKEKAALYQTAEGHLVLAIAPDGEACFEVEIPAKSQTWFVIR